MRKLLLFMIIAVAVMSCKKENVNPDENDNVLKIELTNIESGINIRTLDQKVYLLTKNQLNLQVSDEGVFSFYLTHLLGNEGTINCNVYFNKQKININLLKIRTNVIHYSQNSLWVEK